jgi:hypothetical protein
VCAPEAENQKRKRLVANLSLDNLARKDAIAKNRDGRRTEDEWSSACASPSDSAFGGLIGETAGDPAGAALPVAGNAISTRRASTPLPGRT